MGCCILYGNFILDISRMKLKIILCQSALGINKKLISVSQGGNLKCTLICIYKKLFHENYFLNIFLKVYIGCYDDYLQQLTGLTSSMLSSLNVGPIQYRYYVKIDSITVSFCISLCYLLNFQYAGINGG